MPIPPRLFLRVLSPFYIHNFPCPSKPTSGQLRPRRSPGPRSTRDTSFGALGKHSHLGHHHHISHITLLGIKKQVREISAPPQQAEQANAHNPGQIGSTTPPNTLCCRTCVPGAPFASPSSQPLVYTVFHNGKMALPQQALKDPRREETCAGWADSCTQQKMTVSLILQ